MPPATAMHHDFTPRVLVRSEESDGRVALVENRVPARWEGPPLHHHDFDEAFFVLEGELKFQVDDELRTTGPGELAFAPRNVPHAPANLAGVEPPPDALGDWRDVVKVGPPIGAPS
jgi:quercetin dioxygenase-like cupin family protein